MAGTRKTDTKQETAPVQEQEPAKAQEQETAPAPEQEGTDAPKQSMIKVHNPTNGFFVQPSTGIRIAAKDTKELRDDGWMELQLKAGTLKKA